ncbi:hypothetical protein [Methylobacterium crusticola]|uniref:hypothetical protein n=1 Tax=Methylobacterium crusticola TaxID=1697972 RepID=UPI000FFBF0E3|nr:hypothetical protein [Methylobacterium crusticola]
MRETFHIEIVGPEGAPVQRASYRAGSLDAARERALRLFARARVPQRGGPPVEAVLILDGAGTEVFRWSIWDEGTGQGGRRR